MKMMESGKILKVLVCLLVVGASSSPDQDDLSDIILHIGYNKLDINEKDNFIVILGDVDGGESEFSNVLLNVSTKPRKARGRVYFPSVMSDAESGSLMIDLPGFHDSSNSVADLAAGFFNKIVFDSAKRVKIVIMTTGNDTKNFDSLLDKLVQIVGENYIGLDQSVSVVITKADNSTSDEEEIDNFVNKIIFNYFMILEKFGEQFYLQKRTLLSGLLKRNFTAVFKRPTKEGNPWDALEMKENHRELRQMIFENVKFSSPFLERCRTVVANATIKRHASSILDDSVITLIADMMLKLILVKVLNANFSNKLSVAADIKLEKFYEFQQMFLNLTREEFLAYIIRFGDPFWFDMKFEIKKFEFVRSAITGDASDQESPVLDELKLWMLKRLDRLEYMILHYIQQQTTAHEEPTTPHSDN